MVFLRSLSALSLLVLTACVSTTDGAGGPQFLEDLPDGLAETAGPGQNLQRVTILPSDGCYWYEHRNVVETTLLPLRTAEGYPICSRPRAS